MPKILLKTSEKSKVTVGDKIFHLFSRELASTTTCQLGKSKAQLEVALRCFETGNFWSPAELLFLRRPLFLRGLCSHQVLRSWSHSLFKWKLSLENSSLPGVWTNLWRGSETLFRVRSSTDSPRKWNDLLSIFLTSWVRGLLNLEPFWAWEPSATYFVALFTRFSDIGFVFFWKISLSYRKPGGKERNPPKSVKIDIDDDQI